MSAATDLHTLGVAGAARALREGRCSAVELTRQLLARAQAHHGLGAFLAVNEAAALAQARAADERLARGDAGPLTGVPVAHKDIFVTDFAAS
ncbi:MAG: Asp-tRNA(Asn)/Glu-tRNA(Gln) amidotransferase GatCAB subunit A, partial [Rubrivivax sp.]|nr:Asp-tRNA(Asn)/Glu-tRNA(Gln) amidotransferase GatCAB subunit A [Rubrivivax sp.]